MAEIHLFGLNDVADSTVLEFDVTHLLGAGTFGPINGALIVVVDTGGTIGIQKVYVIISVTEGNDFLNSFVRGADFSFAGGAACAFLVDRFQGDEAAATHDEEAAHGAVLEHINFLTIFDGAANLSTPAGVTEALQQVVRGRWCGSGVGFTIVGKGIMKIG